MRKSIFAYFLLITTLGVLRINAQEVTIGTGTASWYYAPITRLFEYGASESIYDAAEVGTAGTISAIGWNIAGSAYATPTGNVSIYMKMSDQTTVTSPASLSGYTLVYSGNVDNNVLGWQNIPLNTAFNYNDTTKNLMVLVIHASGNYTYGPPTYSYTSSPGKISYYYSISNTWNDTRAMTTTSSNRPNIKLYYTQNMSTVEIEGKNSLKFYPNPAKDFVTISGKQNITSVELYNLMGQKIAATKSDDKEVTLNLSNVPSGNHIIKVNYKDGSSKTTKIIKE